MDLKPIMGMSGVRFYMKKMHILKVREELEAKGIPQLAEKLKTEIGYDSRTRKRKRNPEELRAIDRVRERR